MKRINVKDLLDSYREMSDKMKISTMMQKEINKKMKSNTKSIKSMPTRIRKIQKKLNKLRNRKQNFPINRYWIIYWDRQGIIPEWTVYYHAFFLKSDAIDKIKELNSKGFMECILTESKSQSFKRGI